MCGVLSATALAQKPEIVLDFTAAQTTVRFTLGDVVHTVHGTFALKQGSIHCNPSTGDVSGSIILDATSARTGNGMRDKKMHREVLQSEKFSEITFRPDRVEGNLGVQGTTTLRVHGYFNIHGGDHEMTVPVQVELESGHWSATSHFVVPYEKWGLKNPSTFILRVSGSVEIDVQASGNNP